MDIQSALEQLCAAPGPSGFEHGVSGVAMRLLRPLVDEVYIDRLGSVVGVKRCGKPNARRLVLDAHLDEIGLVVTAIEDGFLHIRAIGGVDPRILPGQELTVLAEEPIHGVVITLPPHVVKAKERKQSLPISELLVDVGLSQEEVQHRVAPGTPVVYRESCFSLGGHQLCGKSMDDRACFVSLLRALELLSGKQTDVDIYVLGSVFEEVRGSAGARAGVYAIEPDWCVAVDVTHGCTPDAPKEKTLKMGEGPAIGIGPNMTRWMSDRMKEKAKALGVPYQLEVMGGHTGTNAWPIQICREGIATALVSLPLKYMHTPVEVINTGDLEGLAQLIAAFALDLEKEAKYLC